MTTQVTISKAQDHVDVHVKIKNPLTGEVMREQIITETEPVNLVIYDSQSLEIEEVQNGSERATGLRFGQAVELLKKGVKVARAGWNGKGMWLSYVSGTNYDVGCGAVGYDPNVDSKVELSPWIGMKTADGKYVPWLASQTDVLAEDWVTVK